MNSPLDEVACFCVFFFVCLICTLWNPMSHVCIRCIIYNVIEFFE